MFDFCWGLFVRVKADFPNISDDLVNSYHLLLSCVDYIYANAVMANRSDLLNEKSLESEDKINSASSKMEIPCIMDKLCRNHHGIISEVKSIREHYWKPHIKRFFEQKVRAYVSFCYCICNLPACRTIIIISFSNFLCNTAIKRRG